MSYLLTDQVMSPASMTFRNIAILRRKKKSDRISAADSEHQVDPSPSTWARTQVHSNVNVYDLRRRDTAVHLTDGMTRSALQL